MALDKIGAKDVTAHVKVDVDTKGLAARVSGAERRGMLPGGALPGPLGGAALPAIAIGATAASVALLALTPAIVGTTVALASFGGFALLAHSEITNKNHHGAEHRRCGVESPVTR